MQPNFQGLLKSTDIDKFVSMLNNGGQVFGVIPAPILEQKAIIEHPVFWLYTEKLEFVINIRDRARNPKDKNFDFLNKHNVDWRSKVVRDPVLKGYLDRHELFEGQMLGSSLFHLVKFFRDASEHINDDQPA